MQLRCHHVHQVIIAHVKQPVIQVPMSFVHLRIIVQIFTQKLLAQWVLTVHLEQLVCMETEAPFYVQLDTTVQVIHQVKLHVRQVTIAQVEQHRQVYQNVL